MLALHIAYFVSIVNKQYILLQGLDASRTWMCFWGLHSLNILGAVPSHSQKAEILAFLKACEHPDGGYGGGLFYLYLLKPLYSFLLLVTL